MSPAQPLCIVSSLTPACFVLHWLVNMDFLYCSSPLSAHELRFALQALASSPSSDLDPGGPVSKLLACMDGALLGHRD